MAAVRSHVSPCQGQEVSPRLDAMATPSRTLGSKKMCNSSVGGAGRAARFKTQSTGGKVVNCTDLKTLGWLQVLTMRRWHPGSIVDSAVEPGFPSNRCSAACPAWWCLTSIIVYGPSTQRWPMAPVNGINVSQASPGSPLEGVVGSLRAPARRRRPATSPWQRTCPTSPGSVALATTRAPCTPVASA